MIQEYGDRSPVAVRDSDIRTAIPVEVRGNSVLGEEAGREHGRDAKGEIAGAGEDRERIRLASDRHVPPPVSVEVLRQHERRVGPGDFVRGTEGAVAVAGENGNRTGDAASRRHNQVDSVIAVEITDAGDTFSSARDDRCAERSTPRAVRDDDP